MADIVFFPGYREDREDREYLTELSMAYAVSPQFSVDNMRPLTRRNWLPVRYQGAMGSCTGFARRAAAMILNYVDTLNRDGEPEIVELSAMYAYLTNQQECGLLGRDQGATIRGCLKASQESGICQERTMPYPNPVRYSITIPAAASAEGNLHLTLKHLRPKNVEQIYQWHQTGMGCTLIGVPWTKRMAESGNRSPSRRGVFGLEDVSGPSMGGHAMCLTGGHSETLIDRKGRPYLEGINSHDIDFGDEGFFYVEPAAVEFWIDSRYAEVICVTDIQEGFNPRRPTRELESAWNIFGAVTAQPNLLEQAWGAKA